MKTKTTLTKTETAQNFFNAVDAINKARNYKDKTVHVQLNANLDKAVAEYIKAHSLSTSLGFFDCMNHYNNTYSK